MSDNSPILPKSGSIDFDTRARLYAWHTDNGVDPENAQPYFEVTYGHPIEFLHDWPDFGDLTARYWEGALMAADMTGVVAANTNRLRDSLLSWFAPNGLNYRPLTPYTTYAAELFDQSRTLLALCTAYMFTGEKRIADQMEAMVDGLIRISEPVGEWRTIPGVRYGKDGWESAALWDSLGSGYFVGPLIRPLVKVWQVLGYEPALELARGIAGYTADVAFVIKPDGEFDSHVHSRLALACGLHACGKAVGEQRWVTVAGNAWNYARSYAGPTGFVPEFLGEGSGRIRCETCALMDYLELTLLLALAGDETKWGEAEKILRNHLIESQAIRDDWGTDGESKPKDQYIWTDNVPHRSLGSFAGWSALDSYFGLTPKGSEGWVYGAAPKEMYAGKMRLFQNCCAGSGMKALYLAWAQAVRREGDRLSVNLLVNRETSDVSVSVREVSGSAVEVAVSVKKPCELSIRLPEWTSSEATKLYVSSAGSISAGVGEHRVDVGAVSAGDNITVVLPYTLRTERFSVQHEKSEPEVFDLKFKGDSVVGIKVVAGATPQEEKNEISALYDAYPLYQRDPADVYGPEPQPTCADASIDWT